MRHDAKVLLDDALVAATRISEVTAGVDAESYVDDWRLRSVVERQCMILGEALGRLRRDHPATAQTIESLGEVVDFRNVLAHGYDRIDSRLVHVLTELRLPALRAAVERALTQA